QERLAMKLLRDAGINYFRDDRSYFEALVNKMLPVLSRGAPSTTVVVMNLYVVCSANIWRSLDASGAIRTRPEYAQRDAVWLARDPRRGAEFRRHSAAHQPARGLEGCQTARHGALRHFF